MKFCANYINTLYLGYRIYRFGKHNHNHVITEHKKKRLNKLGTIYGLLKGWFISKCLKKSTTQFFSIDQVDKNVEF